VLFTQEIYLDYEDYHQPMHSKTKMILQTELLDEVIKPTGNIISLIDDLRPSHLDLSVSINTATLKDNPIVNPWSTLNGSKQSFLTSGQLTKTFSNPIESTKYFGRLEVKLSDNKILRVRTVYNIVDFIADSSGFADILIVFSTTIMTLLFT
jgi:hypothetical protein